jgi:hypothetical protein
MGPAASVKQQKANILGWKLESANSLTVLYGAKPTLAIRPMAFYMADSKISYQDARLDYQQASRCEAYTIVGADALTMLAVDDSGVVRAAVYYPFETTHPNDLASLRGVLQSDDVFRLHFRNHFCAVFHPRLTLVPQRLFDADHLNAYFNLLLTENSMEYGHVPIPEMDCVAVFANRMEEQELCKQLSSRPTVPHLGPALLRAAQYTAPRDASSVFLNVRNRTAQVAVFDRQMLLFYNVMQFESGEDLVYYILLLYDQFRLNALKSPLIIAGNVASDDEALQQLRNYIAHVSFAVAPEKLQFPEVSPAVPEHFFFELISLRHFGR